MNPSIIAAALLAAGLFFLGLAVARLGHRRPLAALRSACAGCFALAVGGLLVALGLNLYTYSRLSYEQPVAVIEFQQTAPRVFRARIEQFVSNEESNVSSESGPQRSARVYELAGDQWQLDARVLKWHAPANLLGLDAQYRLERLSGRYNNAADENSGTRSAHDLGLRQGLDVWRLAQRLQGWLPLVDARYGSATYLPMADGARFSVSLSQSGLIARADNAQAERALRRW